MKKITRIEVRKKENQKIRVAAYARVSTSQEEQLISLEAQKQHYENYIKSHPGWEYVGIYYDEGISGTKTEKREGLLQMLTDCRQGKIDFIVVKSISRFSRNTVDSIQIVRELCGLGIPMYFEKENINTLDAKGEVMMTIMAALAQQESESLSANVRLGIQYRNQQGKVQVNHNWFLGYTKDDEGNLIVDPEQAKVVKRIYREYLEGKSLKQIKCELEADGIRNGAGHKKWHETNIKQILTNEKYIGDALLQKTYTVDIFEKKRSVNNGALPQYYVEGSQEAIIDKGVFLRVQAEMTRRRTMRCNGKRRCYSSKYALSSIVFCDECGDIFRRVTWCYKGKKKYRWRCVNRVEHGSDACSARDIEETELHKSIVKAINKLYEDKGSVLEILEDNITSVLSGMENSKLDAINREMEEMQTQLLSVIGDDEEEERIGNAMMDLKKKRQKLMTNAAIQTDSNERIKELITYLKLMKQEITEYSDDLVRNLVEKVIVKPKTVKVFFKSGVEVEV